MVQFCFICLKYAIQVSRNERVKEFFSKMRFLLKNVEEKHPFMFKENKLHHFINRRIYNNILTIERK